MDLPSPIFTVFLKVAEKMKCYLLVNEGGKLTILFFFLLMLRLTTHTAFLYQLWVINIINKIGLTYQVTFNPQLIARSALGTSYSCVQNFFLDCVHLLVCDSELCKVQTT